MFYLLLKLIRIRQYKLCSHGFGAINQFRSAVGYKFIKAVELLKDVLSDTNEWNAEQVLTKPILNLQNHLLKRFCRYINNLSKVGINSDQLQWK